MSVLEEIFTGIVRTGKSTGKKAKDVADVIGLNANISGSQSRLRELQRELGAFMAEKVFTDLDKKKLQELLEEDLPERSFAVGEWKEMYEKLLYLRSEEEVIEMNNRKISRIRGDKVCPSCGAFLAPGSRFCPQCGAKIEAEAAEAAEEPAAASAEEPAAEPATAPVKEPAAAPVEEPAEAPAEEPSAAPAPEAPADSTGKE